MRGTDGSAPLLIGHGTVVALSPDGRQLAMVSRNESGSDVLRLVPTGAGETRVVDTGALRLQPRTGSWIAGIGAGDAGSLILAARDGEGGERFFEIPLRDGATPRPLTPEGFALAPQGHAVAPDGSLVDDFVIQKSGPVVHVCNAPSPAATASLKIAERICEELPLGGVAGAPPSSSS